MSIPLNFTYQEAQHKVRLELTDSPSEKMISIKGRNYKILGNVNDLSLIKHHLERLESIDFDSFDSFEASLEGIGPYEKTSSIFQKKLIGSEVKIEEKHIVNIESLKEKLELSLPQSAGAMVVVYEKGEQLSPICIGQTSVKETIKHYKILLRDTQKHLRLLESQEKESGPDANRQDKMKDLSDNIQHLKKEISAQEAAQPVNMQTAACIGSGAKMFTAVLSKVLCEKGILSLQTKLSDVLTEEQFQIFEDPESAKKVTLEMLISHTSGLQYFADDNNKLRKGKSLDEILKSMQPKGIRFIANPGDGVYSYSNQIELAAVMIEKAIEKAYNKKMNYADIMKAELLDPLGMTRTSFNKPTDTNVLRAFHEGSSFDAEILDPLMQGAGGLWSCMEDMTKLVEAYGEKGLITPSGVTLISAEGLKDIAQRRGLNGNTGLGLNIEGSIVGKGGSVITYGFTLKMDPSNGNAVISMCNFMDDKKNFDPFAKGVQGALDAMYPDRAMLSAKPKPTEKEAQLAKEGCPMNECDLFFRGDRGYVGVKQINEDPGIKLNWNGQTLPVRNLGEGRYLIFDDGYSGGQILQIITGKHTGTTYAIIEKEGETNAFQKIDKSKMFFPQDTSFLNDIVKAKGIYVSTIKGGPMFKFDIDKSNCVLSIGDFPPVTGLVINVDKDENGTKEVFLQGNCGPFPPDKQFRISRGDVVREKISQELAEIKSELEKKQKEGPSEKIASLEQRISDLQKQLLEQKDVEWYFRVADFINADNINEAIPLTKSF